MEKSELFVLHVVKNLCAGSSHFYAFSMHKKYASGKEREYILVPD
jgi:hypothetical protein